MGVCLNLSLWFSYDFLCSTVYTKKLVSLVCSWKICSYSSLSQMCYRLSISVLFIDYLSHVLIHITHDIYYSKTNLDLNIHSTDWRTVFVKILKRLSLSLNADLCIHSYCNNIAGMAWIYWKIYSRGVV